MEPAKKTSITLPKIVPAFFLKANEDKSFWSNVITGIEYGVDIITTLSGIGNIAKFRHLAKVAQVASRISKGTKAAQFTSVISKIRLAAGAIEISSGTINAMIKLTEVKDTELGKTISEVLFWLELASLGGEVTAAIKNGLRASAKKVISNRQILNKNLDDLIDEGEITLSDKGNLLDEIEGIRGSQIDLLENWDNLKVSGRGRRNGQRLTKSNLRKIKESLDKLGVDLELHELKGSQTIAGFFIRKGIPAKMPEGAAAIFITDGIKMKIVLRQGATVYEFFHEFMHFRHAKKIGLRKYLDLGGRNTPGELIKEQWVFNKIIDNKNYLTKDEIEHALWYINDNIRDKFGENPIPISFDVKDIPIIRTEIKINDVLNKK